jgi:hypothetical protein
MDASLTLARVHHKGAGAWFARQIRSLARFYQRFPQLPPELRGGSRRGTTHLGDLDAQQAARKWLDQQKLGEVTPTTFRSALNQEILPYLNIQLRKPLCDRTARRWLVKLGYRRIELRKGLYVDGHDRADVVEYRDKVFLPKMCEYERRMTHYKGKELVPQAPQLGPGEKRIIALWHDESTMHAKEFKRYAWCAP